MTSTASLAADERAMLDALPDQGPLIEAVDQDQPPVDTTDEAELEVQRAREAEEAAAAAAAAKKPEGDKPQTTDTKETPEQPAEQAEQPKGDLRKALRASRRAELQAREEADRLRKELEESRKQAGTEEDPDPLDYTEEQLEDLKENFPSQYRAVVRAQQLAEENRRLKAANPEQTSQEWLPPVFPDKVQDVIDQVPKLAAWQYSEADQPKFKLATQYDAALVADPDWADKPPAERFQEAVRRTEAKLGVKPAPAAKTTDPAALAAAATERKPSGISDFRGGGPADAPANDFNKLSDDQILASLDRAHIGTRR